MRKFLLMAAISAVVKFSGAQGHAQKPFCLENPRISAVSNEDRPMVTRTTANHNTSTVTGRGRTTTGNNAKSLLNGTALNSIPVGTSGNLLTITTFNCNQLYVNTPLNLVSFIHRSDPAVNVTENIAEYSFDFSKDGGNTWQSNIGPITNAPDINNNGTNPHGRFPQALIYNPANNLLADSALLIYSGTWHNAPVNATSGTWMGQMRGRGHFNGDSSTFNVHVDTINNGATDIATGMCQSVPGTFWAVNEDWTGTFSTSSNEITRGIIVEKGVWDANANDVVWTSNEIHQQFDSFTSSSLILTAAQSFNIAFDPTGQIGWIACLGDVANHSLNPQPDSSNNPIFWKSTDGGNTWSQAMQIPLDSLPGVKDSLLLSSIYPISSTSDTGLLTSGIPTTSFEANLTVDVNGNPHLLCTVGNLGTGYSIEGGATYMMYDVTLHPSDSACRPTWNGWAAVDISRIATLRGNTTSDATPLTEDNRPLVSRTADGKRLYFLWEDSDPNFLATGNATIQGDNNQYRNLFIRGYDVAHSTSTPVVNLTQGDANWGGPTVAYPSGGLYGAANYPTVSPIVYQQGTNDIIPLILTQIDISGQDMSDGEAQFWYINNLSFSQYDFTNGLSALVTPNGSDTITLVKGTAYQDSGATITYLDTACSHSGLLHIVTNEPGLNVNVPGTYIVYYTAEDDSGNIYASAQRVVLVVSAPVANFGYQNTGNNTIQFSDSSLYNPTSWTWDFGDGQNAYVQNPNHPYAHYGNYNVCLTAGNAYGTSAQVCKEINVVNGIKQIDFSSNINLFPNPTAGYVTLSLTGNAVTDITVSVYNMLGEQVMPTSDYKAGVTNVELNAANLADGVYLVRVQSNQGSAVKRLTVAHK